MGADTKKAPGSAGTEHEGQSQGRSNGPQDEVHTTQKENDMNVNIIPEATDNLKQRAKEAELDRAIERVERALQHPASRAEIVRDAREFLSEAIEEGSIDPDDLGDRSGFTLGQFEWHLSGDGENATAEVVAAAIVTVGEDIGLACAAAEAMQAAEAHAEDEQVFTVEDISDAIRTAKGDIRTLVGKVPARTSPAHFEAVNLVVGIVAKLAELRAERFADLRTIFDGEPEGATVGDLPREKQLDVAVIMQADQDLKAMERALLDLPVLAGRPFEVSETAK